MKKYTLFLVYLFLLFILLISNTKSVHAWDSGCSSAGPYSVTTGKLCSKTATAANTSPATPSITTTPNTTISSSVTIDNVNPRRDTNGNIIDAHDGSLMYFGGKYYLYGTTYGSNNNGWVPSLLNYYSSYSSTDLVTWKLDVSHLLINPPQGTYYRPYVIFNATTHKYVLWYNWQTYDASGKLVGNYGVATSDVPEGPFKIQNSKVSVTTPTPGDQGLFVDSDGAAYLIHTDYDSEGSPTRGRIRIEKLSADYLNSTQEYYQIPADGDNEAPAMFKRDGTYYALFGSFCGFCSQGGTVQVWTASTPLGPYTYRGGINGSISNPTIGAQQTHIAKIATTNGDVLIWMGDRWHSTPDVDINNVPIKGHDFQYWSPPLQFDASGNIIPLKWTDTWNVALAAPAATPITPTVSFTANGQHNLSVSAGTLINYSWTTVNADTVTSYVTTNNQDNCGRAYPGQSSWLGAIPLNGTNSGTIPQCQSGTTYTITIKATNSSTGASAIDQVVEAVAVLASPSVADIKANGSDGPIYSRYKSTPNITWTSSGYSKCSVSPALSGISNGLNNTSGTLTFPLIASLSNTFNLICDDQVRDSVTVNIPPAPTDPQVSCGADGTSATLKWTSVFGWNHHYVRISLPDYTQQMVVGTPSGNTEDYVCSGSCSFTYTNLTPGKVYAWWVHARDPIDNNIYSQGVPMTPPDKSRQFSCNSTTASVNTNQRVLGAEKFNFTRLLRLGSYGNEVTELQKLLNTAGYNVGTTDGNFGIQTKLSVIQFQTANGLIGDGIVGAFTRGVLNK